LGDVASLVLAASLLQRAAGSIVRSAVGVFGGFPLHALCKGRHVGESAGSGCMVEQAASSPLLSGSAIRMMKFRRAAGAIGNWGFLIL
jgi:hypothetical protein